MLESSEVLTSFSNSATKQKIARPGRASWPERSRHAPELDRGERGRAGLWKRKCHFPDLSSIFFRSLQDVPHVFDPNTKATGHLTEEEERLPVG